MRIYNLYSIEKQPRFGCPIRAIANEAGKNRLIAAKAREIALSGDSTSLICFCTFMNCVVTIGIDLTFENCKQNCYD